MDVFTLAIAIGLGIESLVSLYCALRFRSWYFAKGEGEPYLERLKKRNLNTGIFGLGIAAVIVYSLLRYGLPQLELGPLVAPIGAILIGGALAWLQWGPIDDWLAVRTGGPRNG